jgi:hypothetical protein
MLRGYKQELAAIGTRVAQQKTAGDGGKGVERKDKNGISIL